MSKDLMHRHSEHLFQLWVDNDLQDDAVADAMCVAWFYEKDLDRPRETVQERESRPSWFD